MHYSHSLARLVPLILALTAGCAKSTTPPAPPTPESTVVRLAGRAPALGSVCASLTAVEAAVRGGRIAGGAPVFLDDRFPVGSLTKSMTATLAAVLVDEGVIAWDSRLLEVLPELQAGARPEYANVILRDLPTHRAGVPTPTSIDSLPELSGDDATQRIQFARWALARPALQPSSWFGDYSNGG